MLDGTLLGTIYTVVIPLVYVIGFISALDAVMRARTPQGSTAWAVALSLMPFIALPLYFVLGRSKFDGYIEAVRSFDQDVEDRLRPVVREELAPWIVRPDAEDSPEDAAELRGFAAIARIPFTRGNGATLLINGEATFAALFEALAEAQSYILAQFYIIHDDKLGTRFQEALMAAAKRGVRVYLLYDEVGSSKLPRRYVRTLRDAGVHVGGFGGERGWLGRFRINFRNHRKIVVVDGAIGFVGGLNVGDEYCGHHPTLTPWRDTHLRLEGPTVRALQLSFVRDWRYVASETLEGLDWSIRVSEKNQRGLILASGPADEIESCRLLFAHAISSAVYRVWIATPYFVPDSHVLGALQAAALRGVDVRVIMPRMSDNALFKYVPYAYLPEADRAGVKTYLYEDGFMHQKVFLVDNDYAAVGTANLDNRSFRLNFEVTCLMADKAFASDVEAMLVQDLEHCTRLTAREMNSHPWTLRAATAGTRLLAPIL